MAEDTSTSAPEPRKSMIHDDVLDTDAAQEIRTKIAGVTLVKMASGDLTQSREVLFEDEKDVLEECFARGQSGRNFAGYHIQAIRSGLRCTNNINIVRLLLAKDLSNQLLRDDVEILLVAVREYGESHRKSVPEMVQLLISHGAPINTLDDQGNSSLYYACLYGLLDVFQVLIDSGADYMTWHNRLDPSSGREYPRVIFKPIYKVLLLQITVDALSLVSGAYGSWVPIIMFLADSGLTVPLNDPAVTTLIDAACYFGILPHVEKFLGGGVCSDTERSVIDSHSLSLNAGLHAAVIGGHKETTIYLLCYGACASAKHLYQTYSNGDCLLTAIAAVCGNYRNKHIQNLRTRQSGYLDACEALFDAGVDEEDQIYFLEESARKNRIGTVRRLLTLGIRTEKVPLSSSLDVV